MLVPDYGKPVTIASEGSDHNTKQYLISHAGNYISQYYPSGHFWCWTTYYTDKSVGGADSRIGVNSALSYTIPSSGYLYAVYSYEGWAFKNVMSSLRHNRGFGLCVMIYRDGNWLSAFREMKSIDDNNSENSTLIPVSKGDVIYYGTWYDYNALPSGYQIVFYPGKSVDAKTGD